MSTTTDNSQIKSQQIDAVLPLTLKDYERFTILQKSLKTFCKDIRVCWIVTPDRDYAELKSLITDDGYCVIPESSIVPEFQIFQTTGGWYRQQVIKIAIAQKVETDFYLTLDSDVICVRPTHFSDFVKDGRGVCYIDKTDKLAEWYEWSEPVLQLKRSGGSHNVTPAVMNKHAMIELQEYLAKLSLAQLSQKGNVTFQKKGMKLLLSKILVNILPKQSKLRSVLISWKSYLLRNLPWTEYALYYTFLEAMGLFDRYHVQVEDRLYAAENSVWYKDRERFSEWNPEKCFVGERNFFFCIVQSNTKISPRDIWDKVHPYFVEA